MLYIHIFAYRWPLLYNMVPFGVTVIRRLKMLGNQKGP